MSKTREARGTTVLSLPAPERVVVGRVTYGTGGLPAAGVRLIARDADLLFDADLGETTTDADGRFSIAYGIAEFRDLWDRAPDIYLIVKDAEGRFLTDTRHAVVRDAGRLQEILVQLPGGGPREAGARTVVGGVAVDALAFAKLTPENVLALANLAVHERGDPAGRKTLTALSEELRLDRLRAQLCVTPLVRFLQETVRVRQWARDVALRLEEILIGYDPSAAYATFTTPHFVITWQASGDDQPPTGDAGGPILMPGTGAAMGSIEADSGVPDYIGTLAFWLEHALASYTRPPFALRDPSEGARIPVAVTGTAPGFTHRRAMTIGRALRGDLLAAVPTHLLMHLIQERYRSVGSGNWDAGLTEGGALLGEDVVFGAGNRFLAPAEARGTLAFPQVALDDPGARASLALFLKYLAEQQSSRMDPAADPAIGVEAYRSLLEHCDAAGYTDGAMTTAIGDLPWYQQFFAMSYLDAERLDETSSETLLGNFWLACYLKDFGDAIPDRRFRFLQDAPAATWDSIFLGAGAAATAAALSLTATATLPTAGSVTLSAGGGGRVAPFAARFYRIAVDAGVDTLRLDFAAGSGFARPLVQVLLVEQGNVVRDILRTDRPTWSRTIANPRSGRRLDHVLVVVAGTDVGGAFSLSVRDVPAAPDVTVTRWHHAVGTHYEIDPFAWAWTWMSPDVWIDNDGDGRADAEVFFNRNNKLFVRLHNQGTAHARGVAVALWYQNATGGLRDDAWMPVQNAAGVPQSLHGLALDAGTSGQWSVDWSPAPSGGQKHFCLRAVVTAPGDPNVDNKRCLTNFGNVTAAGPYLELSLLRRPVDGRAPVRVDVIPRTRGRWEASLEDVARAAEAMLPPGIDVVDTVRVRRRARLKRLTSAAVGGGAPSHAGARRELTPDPLADYPTDARALPPGFENVPLITIAHVADGRPIGGFTWAIRE